LPPLQYQFVKYLKSNKMARNDLKGKVVLIAGGAKNLGGLLSRDFANKGAKVAIHYNSDSTKADAKKLWQTLQTQVEKHFYIKQI
jgi:NAD(P)-dependent dehydrogenase (short-subunit alcohol dehydrogenase family)